MNLKITAVSALLSIFLINAAAQAQNQPTLIGATNPSIGGKGTIEVPLERFIRTKSGPPAAWSNRNTITNRVVSSRSETVQAGLVAWRPDFATACQASARSGKPVLLFQMMGKLDERFC